METVLALENVRALVEAADGTIEDIVQCTIYLSDMALLAEVNQSYGDFFCRSGSPSGANGRAGERDAGWSSAADSSPRVFEKVVSVKGLRIR